MARPVRVLPFRVFEPSGGLPWKTDHQNVVPSVFIEVVNPNKEIVRVSILRPEPAFEARNGHGRHRPEFQLKSCLRRVNFMPLLVIRTFPPPGPRDDVVHTV